MILKAIKYFLKMKAKGVNVISIFRIKGHRIRASGKHLVYHFSIGTLLFVFVAGSPATEYKTAHVSEFKYYNGIEVHKVYLSAILDLYDRRIVSFKISDHNDNPLVMDTFDEAVCQEPDAHPLVHSDRGFQYTSAQFYTRLKKHHMKQSMSRVAHYIDNGPMEGFWGILKREMYYKQRFNNRSSLITAIANYIDYYNNQRLQRKLHVMTPMKYHEQYTKAA